MQLFNERHEPQMDVLLVGLSYSIVKLSASSPPSITLSEDIHLLTVSPHSF